MDDINVVDSESRIIWIGDGGAYGTFNIGVADHRSSYSVPITIKEMKKLRKKLKKLIKEYDVGDDKEEQVWW